MWILLLCLGTLMGAESALAADRIALTARDDVVIEVWRERASGEARAVLASRRQLPAVVTFAVGATPLSLVEYEQRLEAGQTIAFAEAPVVAAGAAIRPELRIVRVAPLPIEEASGYVRICEDSQAGGVSVAIFRPATGGNRAYAVLTNASDRAVTVEWQTLGFVDGAAPVYTTHLPARTTKGGQGEIVVVHHPPADPNALVQARVRLLTVARQP